MTTFLPIMDVFVPNMTVFVSKENHEFFRGSLFINITVFLPDPRGAGHADAFHFLVGPSDGWLVGR